MFVGWHASLGLTSSHSQVPLITKERSAQGMVTPHQVGKAPDYQIVLQAVHVTIVKWDTLLAMHIQAKPPTTS